MTRIPHPTRSTLFPYTTLFRSLNRYEDHAEIRGVQPIVVPHQSTLMHVFSYFKREKKHPIYVTFPNKGRKSIEDRKSTRLNSSHVAISYAVFCLKKTKYNTRYI